MGNESKFCVFDSFPLTILFKCIKIRILLIQESVLKIMSKVKEFFLSLSKSTKITLISCGCFILMTFLILVFFVLFPITPSERALASIGRESFINNEGSEAAVTTTEPAVTTAAVTSTETKTTPSIYSEPLITFTTVSGFLSEGYIPTGEAYVNNFSTTTTTTTTAVTTDENGSSGEQTGTVTEEPTGDMPEEPTQDTTGGSVEPTEPPATEPTAPPATEPTEPPAAEPEEPEPEEADQTE